ncbi:hypothetical protein [Novosphingobium sp.]|uniref:hypothetical protein n=1 Tax=Novosphingobium sp. TaxID=1874826 RepID=UPI00286E66DD|nr:hypothetical protein [Novosphingobium sp.]
MNDEFLNRTTQPMPPRRSGGGRLALASALLAFVLGAGGVGYLAWAGMLPWKAQSPDPTLVRPLAQPVPAPSASPGTVPVQVPVAEAAMAVRIVALEQRLAQIDLRAQAASGNAARAEGLLVALAARRALDKGVPLGYLEDQLRLRFGTRHMSEVNVVAQAAKNPVTLDKLLADLETLAPKLSGAPARGDFWAAARSELGSLFVVRHDDAPSPAPQNRIERARLMLISGKVKEAVAEIQALPGAAAARDWTDAASRFATSRAALDLLESAALLEAETPSDAVGKAAMQPSPVNSLPAN